MAPRNQTIVLAVIAASMAIYILAFERGSLSTSELEQRRNHVLARFVRTRVDELRISRDGTTITVRRVRDEEDGVDYGHWVVTSPLETEGDQEAIDGLVSALEFMMARRRLDGITEQDRGTFGFDAPRITFSFEAAGEHTEAKVGVDDPRGEGVYLWVSDQPDTAFIVGRDVLDTLSHDVDQYRSKELFERFSVANTQRATLKNLSGAIEIRRTDEQWWLYGNSLVSSPIPDGTLGRDNTIREMLNVILDARATRFVADPDLAALGLEQPTRELTIEQAHRDQTGADEARPTLRLRVGGACPGHPDEWTALASEDGEDGPVVCVSPSSLQALDSTPERLAEKRLVTMRDTDIERVNVEVGTSSFELRRAESGWKLVRAGVESDADGAAVSDWLNDLRSQQAELMSPLESPSAHGFAQPSAQIRLASADGDAQRTETIVFGASSPEGVWVRRGAEQLALRFPAAAGALAMSATVRFRAREIVVDAAENLRSLRIERGTATAEVLVKDGAIWRVREPIEVEADRVLTQDLARSISELSALRFVSDAASAEHGLMSPRFRLTATFEGNLPEPDAEDDHEHDHDHGEPTDTQPAAERAVTLEIGEPTEGGAFARKGGDDAVFVLPETFVDQLVSPLVSRDVLATATPALETLTLVRNGERMTLQREGEGWTVGGDGDPLADDARTTLVLDRLASLRATGTTGYGVRVEPQLRLEVVRRRGEPQRYDVEIGEQVGDAGYLARRSDLEVGFIISPAAMETFANYRP